MLKKTLVAFLGLNGLMQLAVSMSLLFAAQTAVPAIFAAPYAEDNAMVVAAMGVAVFMSTCLIALSVFWIVRDDVGGAYLGALFGLWSLGAGMVFLLRFGSPGAWFDLARGVIIFGLALAWLSGRQRPLRAPSSSV